MTRQVIARYAHDPLDPATIWLAVTADPPTEDDWLPAYRDTIEGAAVVWVRIPDDQRGVIWLRDKNGVRRVGTLIVRN